jgi:hypothetical protein
MTKLISNEYFGNKNIENFSADYFIVSDTGDITEY